MMRSQAEWSQTVQRAMARGVERSAVAAASAARRAQSIAKVVWPLALACSSTGDATVLFSTDEPLRQETTENQPVTAAPASTEGSRQAGDAANATGEDLAQETQSGPSEDDAGGRADPRLDQPRPLDPSAEPIPCGQRGEVCCGNGVAACAPGLGCETEMARCQPCAAFEVLPNFPGYDFSAARGISGDGRWVVGRSGGEGVPERGVLWDRASGRVVALGTLPGGVWSIAHAISRDGGTVVGMADASDGGTSIVLWRGGGKPQWLGYGEGYAVSADGRIVTGRGELDSLRQGFVWNQGESLQPLGPAEGDVQRYYVYRGYAMSGDGSVVAGDFIVNGEHHAMRWTARGGYIDLGVLPGGNDSVGSTISVDGSVVYGLSNTSEGASWVFRWTQAEGMRPVVPTLDTYESNPATNAAGDVVVGRSYGYAFRWTHGSDRARSIRELLGRVAPEEWELYGATAVSDDGRIVAGFGQAPERPSRGAWVAVIGPQCASEGTRGGEASAAPALPPAGEPLSGPCGEPGAACCQSAGAECSAGFGCDQGLCTACRSFRDLPALPGHIESLPYAISRDGRVAVGLSRLTGNAPSEAVRWDVQTGQVEALGNLPYSRAMAVSGDGSVAVGFAATSDVRDDALVWKGGGVQTVLEGARAVAVSADGSLVFGFRSTPQIEEAFQWSEAGGSVSLGEPYGLFFSQIFRANHDGSVIVGGGAFGEGYARGLIWSAGAVDEIAPLIEQGYLFATDTSDDGSVVVGSAEGPTITVIFRWTPSEGPTVIATDARNERFPPAVDASGLVVVGSSRGRALLWDAVSGRQRPLHELLGDEVPSGWVLRNATDISANARTVVGRGRAPYRETAGWAATLGPACEEAAR